MGRDEVGNSVEVVRCEFTTICRLDSVIAARKDAESEQAFEYGRAESIRALGYPNDGIGTSE